MGKNRADMQRWENELRLGALWLSSPKQSRGLIPRVMSCPLFSDTLPLYLSVFVLEVCYLRPQVLRSQLQKNKIRQYHVKYSSKLVGEELWKEGERGRNVIALGIGSSMISKNTIWSRGWPGSATGSVSSCLAIRMSKNATPRGKAGYVAFLYI